MTAGAGFLCHLTFADLWKDCNEYAATKELKSEHTQHCKQRLLKFPGNTQCTSASNPITCSQTVTSILLTIPALQGGNEAERHRMSLAGTSSVSRLTGHLQNSTQSNRDPSKRKPFHSSHWAILMYLSLLNSCPYPSSLPKETWHCLFPPANVLLPICVESQRDGYSVLYIYTPHICLPNERCYDIWVKKKGRCVSARVYARTQVLSQILLPTWRIIFFKNFTVSFMPPIICIALAKGPEESY